MYTALPLAVSSPQKITLLYKSTLDMLMKMDTSSLDNTQHMRYVDLYGREVKAMIA